ncbi:MAG: hypothetical protein V1493_06600 [Candidatus Diapherotrites archaeon]
MGKRKGLKDKRNQGVIIMKMEKLSKEELELVKVALETVRMNRVDTKAISSSVGCALLAGNGLVYIGANIKNLSSSPVSVCAEMSAVSSMFSDGQRKIKFIAAVHMEDRKSDNWKVLQPCGACRHIIGEFGNPWVAVSKAKKARLADLYPLPVKKK